MPDKRDKTRDAVNTGTQYRMFGLERAGIDEEKRTIPLSFSSEEPYKRWWGTEILDHTPQAVRLSRLQQRGPLLLDHNPESQIGVVEDVELTKDKRGRAVVRFGKSARARFIKMFSTASEAMSLSAIRSTACSWSKKKTARRFTAQPIGNPSRCRWCPCLPT